MVKALIAPIAGAAAAIALAACGGGLYGSGNTSGNASGNASGSAATTLSVRSLSGVGSVLVDANGNALYSPDQEASGMILCTGTCNAFWKPLTTTSGAPTGPTDAGQLGVIKRPDGTTQVTANGKPLYMFTQDSPGNATGDGFTDDFDGHHFNWHVVHSTGAGNPSGAGAASTPGASGVSTPGASSSYGY